MLTNTWETHWDMRPTRDMNIEEREREREGRGRMRSRRWGEGQEGRK
jgi:hypothetical protein